MVPENQRQCLKPEQRLLEHYRTKRERQPGGKAGSVYWIELAEWSSLGQRH